jgi:hypothetical protein
MKYFLALVASGILAICASEAQAQSRDFGARKLILDDGIGGRLTVSYTGPGNSTFIIPPGGATTVQPGFAPNQTLRWNGVQWLASSVMTNDATNITIPTGNLTVTAGTITGNGSGLTNLNASNITTGSLALARISTAGAVMNQSLMFDGANLVYGNPPASSLVIPFSQTASDPGALFSLTNLDGVAGYAGAFAVTNPTNNGVALYGGTNGIGYGVYGLATGSGSAVVGMTGFAATGSAGTFTTFNAANASPTLTITSSGSAPAVNSVMSGTGRNGYFAVTNAANNAIALHSITSGTGIAGAFTISNTANNSDALSVMTNGGGNAGDFASTNPANNVAALVVTHSGSGAALAAVASAGPAIDATGSATGVSVFAGASSAAFAVTRGRFEGSYTTMASGGVVPTDYMVVEVQDNGAGVPATATLPAGVANGTFIMMVTNDPEGLQVNGVGQARGDSRLWVKTGDLGFGGNGWKADF